MEPVTYFPRIAPTLGFSHSDKVQALSYAQHTRQLISCGGDGGIVVWNMDVERQEVGEAYGSASAPLLLISIMSKPGNKIHCMVLEKSQGRRALSLVLMEIHIFVTVCHVPNSPHI